MVRIERRIVHFVFFLADTEQQISIVPLISRFEQIRMEQARDTVLPRIEVRRQFKPFVEDEVPEIARNTLCLVAQSDADLACPHGVEKPVALAVGPEGGFIPNEIEAFQRLGFTPVSIGGENSAR